MTLYDYPGVNIDLRHYPQGWESRDVVRYPIGAHTNCYGADSDMLPVREVFMMMLMDSLTDKPNWQEKVFDEEIVAKWRKEAMEQPEDDIYLEAIGDKQKNWAGRDDNGLPKPRSRVLSEVAFDYCIAELRDKAEYFKKTGLIRTLDSAGNNIIKSDTFIPPELHRELVSTFDKLREDQSSNVDWHPRSGDMVQNLVHPSMYPFIYGIPSVQIVKQRFVANFEEGQSKFIREEVVGVADAVDKWSGKGEPVPKEKTDVNVVTGRNRAFQFGYSIGGSKVPPNYWSNKYQWLPANLKFQEDGTVKFTSYINNLHPKKYPQIYRTIEKLVDKAIPLWDHCLGRYDPDRHRKTVNGRGASRFSKPTEANDSNDKLWEPFNPEEMAKHDVVLTERELQDIKDHLKYNYHPETRPYLDGKVQPGDSEEVKNEKRLKEATEKKMWQKFRDPILPEPDAFQSADYTPKDNLREHYKESGLQIIVKIASIELTPEKPDFPVGGWHIEGQMNERICGTALYYLDSENVTPSHLSFRMQTSSYQDELQDATGQDAYNWLERVYGTSLFTGTSRTNACLQTYGTVETKQGRLLAFPNVFQHRVSPFSLKDPTKPGHRRFIALWLVDPHQRIISTGNVPPQQLDWWAEEVFGTGDGVATGDMPKEMLELLFEAGFSKHISPEVIEKAKSNNLPQELLDLIKKEGFTRDGLMTVEEAKKHRLELMDERSAFHRVAEDGYKRNHYSFCEH